LDEKIGKDHSWNHHYRCLPPSSNYTVVDSSPRSFISPSRRRIAFSVGVGGTPREINAANRAHSPAKRSTQATPFLPRYVFVSFASPATLVPSTILKIILVTTATWNQSQVVSNLDRPRNTYYELRHDYSEIMDPEYSPACQRCRDIVLWVIVLFVEGMTTDQRLSFTKNGIWS
jgi:hypothetical protein